jgi:hypothetical protein
MATLVGHFLYISPCQSDLALNGGDITTYWLQSTTHCAEIQHSRVMLVGYFLGYSLTTLTFTERQRPLKTEKY